MAYLRGIFYSLPVQLLFLHFRKYQLLLVFWLVLFASVSGGFMKTFGADALFLAPEYLGNVNALSFTIVGIAVGVYIMCWNITTFILFSRHFDFLAATQYPFLKYCINNSVIPISFLIYFLIKATYFARYKELIPTVEVIFLVLGFLTGLFLALIISFFYFFGADKTILKRLQPHFKTRRRGLLNPSVINANSLMKTEWFLDSFIHVRRCRDVSHYSPALMEKIFKRHHFAAVVAVLLAYLLMVITGFFLDYKVFQIPAAASLLIFLAILIGISGAITYFFQSWSIPFLTIFFLILNFLYSIDWIDPRNKAYGLDYSDQQHWPEYSQESLQTLAQEGSIDDDRDNMVSILNKWKQKQGVDKPLLVVINTSGGGTRSATFTMNVLERLDSLLGNQIMNKTFIITGASGGMIGASYYRELYREKIKNPSINLHNPKYVDDIAQDLLNPLFSSFIARDLFAPEQKFSVGPYTYLKDRGYAFEAKLNDNTHGLLNKRLKDYISDEKEAAIPLMLFHTVITRDGKQMLISTQPMRFMMQASVDTANIATRTPDAVDFASMFANQDPYNLRMLTILRMNATFPVVLPNVWLPTKPVIDVMDGGLRDNYGVGTSLRFLYTMQDWIKQNTRGVLVIQIRDRMDGGWENPYEATNITENVVKPFFLLQHNWYKMMEYFQNDMSSYLITNAGFPIHKVVFQYTPSKEENKAALNFHLTQIEKLDIASSLNSEWNSNNFKRVDLLLNGRGK
ncbi:MAG: hypothetical protein C4330_02515 [Chitinophagaceae bacterium]